ncbi:SipW-dependent-type signal peptide-containing protein [Brachybacterium sp. AOP43-C2-M15]|uniref:SipW-dependent-type signal peptide-containing protein n=1 Tax=Brachybacterium sp. AOP43-C2-M15 TaxID=3457661 RepID=UPI0040332F7B
MSTATTDNSRGRKVRALLAGGLVLGVGAAVTLAAWTDQEWAIGEFGAGSFNVEGSTDGSAFADHDSEAGAAQLEFEVDADNLTPEDVVAAPFVLRLDDATTYDATVELTDAAGSGANAAHLTYGIIEVGSAAECTDDATGSAIVPAGTALDSGTAGFDLVAGADGEAGAPVTLCFQVTAGPDLLQGETGTATWGFTATSVE